MRRPSTILTSAVFVAIVFLPLMIPRDTLRDLPTHYTPSTEAACAASSC